MEPITFFYWKSNHLTKKQELESNGLPKPTIISSKHSIFQLQVVVFFFKASILKLSAYLAMVFNVSTQRKITNYMRSELQAAAPCACTKHICNGKIALILPF